MTFGAWLMTGRIITIAQQKGGSGKTTIAAHVAVALARQGHPVGLLDVDPQGSLGEWYERREHTLGEHDTGLSFCTASGWGARREARSLARDHEVVIVDTPPKADIEAGPAIETADLVAAPVQPTPVDLWATSGTLGIIAREQVPAVLVINRVPARASAEILAAIRDSHGAARSMLGNRVAFGYSMGHGLTVLETEPSGKAAAEAEALATELLDMIKARR
jgi:chromosome partitioning protein